MNKKTMLVSSFFIFFTKNDRGYTHSIKQHILWGQTFSQCKSERMHSDQWGHRVQPSPGDGRQQCLLPVHICDC